MVNYVIVKPRYTNMPKLKHKLLFFGLSIIMLTAVSAARPALAACDNTTQTGIKKCLSDNKLVTDLNDIVNFLSALVGVVVIAVIIMGGIQYAMAGDSSDAVGKAKSRIVNGLIALVAFIFTFAFLQWIIPGGVFG
jgi:cytochrome bd-type quinol oxidase subunit 2